MTRSAVETPVSDAIVTLAEFVLQTDFGDLPEAVVHATKSQVLDTLGVALAGGAEAGVRQLKEFAVEMSGRPESHIWGTGVRVPAQDAARVNATMSHALDYDDTYERSFLHPAVITIPAALACAELSGVDDGAELIAAIAVGVDVAARLSDSARPGVAAFDHGWHNTSLYGYFASTMVAGRLLRLTRDELVSAAGIAFHQAAGNSQAHLDGALTKRMGPGFASYAGVLAARLAQRGVQGARAVLEGARGFYYQYHGSDYSRDILLGGLGETFASTGVSFKPWPSCRGSHTAADAALSLFGEAGIDASEVEGVTVYNGPAEYSLLASPLSRKQSPGSPVDAQFSIPWVVSAALVDHRVALEHFTSDAVARPDLLAAAQLIRTVEDTTLARPGGGVGAARVEARLKDGRTLRATATVAKGEPSNPMTADELHRKFFDCARVAGVEQARARALLARVEGLGSSSVRSLTELLAG